MEMEREMDPREAAALEIRNDKILEAAEEVKADLIVVGDRGLGSVDRFPLGSIAYKVSQHSKCPVLVIK